MIETGILVENKNYFLDIFTRGVLGSEFGVRAHRRSGHRGLTCLDSFVHRRR